MEDIEEYRKIKSNFNTINQRNDYMLSTGHLTHDAQITGCNVDKQSDDKDTELIDHL